MQERTVDVDCVRFSCFSGAPKLVQDYLILRENETLDAWVLEFKRGVTGYESLIVTGPGAADLERLCEVGWWACAGTTGCWDSLFVHPLQLKRVFEDLGLLEKETTQ